MPILSDCHMHSYHSGDSETPMEDMVREAIAKGLTTICFTEHNDFMYPDTEAGPGSIFELNVDSYLYELITLKEKYADQIRILFGVELGLQPECFRENAILAKTHEFDFIIGSSHLLDGGDPYYPSFWETKSETELHRRYFESELANAKRFSNFDVYGHLDYIFRYGPTKDTVYSYRDYADVIDELLKVLIEKGKGIELNTGGLRHKMRYPNPAPDVLKRYIELGGEIITVGSDAHSPARIALEYDFAADYLKECGFQYYTVFEKRHPEFHKL